MFKSFLNLPLGRLCTVETLPHYNLNLTFQSATQGNVNMFLNLEDAKTLRKMIDEGIEAMGEVEATSVNEEEE